MIEVCPVCRAADVAPVWHRERSPILQFLPAGHSPAESEFCELFIVQCSRCRHVYNRAFDASTLERMYTSENLSNVPVIPAMQSRLEQTAEWIGWHHFKNRTVVEIGGGSGAMARIVARDAREVFVYEPSRGITADAFLEPNVVLVPEMFAAVTTPRAADVVICRHVLEHTMDPLWMLTETRRALSPDGCAYFEVPNFEFIDAHAALFDFHAAHVQYFAPERLAALAAQAGLHLLRCWASRDGRDFGLLFGQRGAVQSIAAAPAAARGLAGRLRRRHDRFVEFFEAQRDRMLLYGATWTGLAFLNAFNDPPPFECVLDDNGGYAGLSLYHPHMNVPVRPPDIEWLGARGDLFICPYQHADGIAAKVATLGFHGRIHNINRDPQLADAA